MNNYFLWIKIDLKRKQAKNGVIALFSDWLLLQFFYLLILVFLVCNPNEYFIALIQTAVYIYGVSCPIPLSISPFGKESGWTVARWWPDWEKFSRQIMRNTRKMIAISLFSHLTLGETFPDESINNDSAVSQSWRYVSKCGNLVFSQRVFATFR